MDRELGNSLIALLPAAANVKLISALPFAIQPSDRCIVLVSSCSHPDWFEFYLDALRSAHPGRCFICGETSPPEVWKQGLGLGEPLVFPGKRFEPLDAATATLSSYLHSAIECGEEPDNGFLEWLAILAPELRGLSLSPDSLELARTAQILSTTRTKLEQHDQSRELERLRQALADSEEAKTKLEDDLKHMESLRDAAREIFANAEAELRQARLLAMALPKLRSPKSAFDDQLYLALYPDVTEFVRAGNYSSAHDHWLRRGCEEGRIPAMRPFRADVPLYFDEAAYLRHYPEAAAAVARGEVRSGFDYWTAKGLRQGHRFNPDLSEEPVEQIQPSGFDTKLYCFFNPDVAAAVRAGGFAGPEEHWKHHGDFEGRAGGPLDLIEDRRQFYAALDARTPGVNLYGFLSSPSGLGSLARGAVKALEAESVRFQTLGIPSWSNTGIPRVDTIDKPYRVNLILQNADMMGRFLRGYGKELLHGAYNIGYWLWELPSARMDWAAVYRYVDEVWVASEYCRHAFQTLTQIPVTRIPLVVDGLEQKAIFGREHFNFPKDVFVFCYIYDISSQLERKNPACLIRAFQREFGSSRDVLLFLKSSNSAHDPRQAKELGALAQAPNIRLFDGVLSEEETVSLHNAIDCFVSPHRAEGFGFNLAEAMYFGKPVIGTGYSSNLDFMNEANSYLINYRLTPIRESIGPYLKGSVWAEPEIEHLQSLLRRVFENAAEREEKGRKAQQEIQNHYSAKAVGQMMQDRLRTLGLEEAKVPRDLIVPHTMQAWPRFRQRRTPRPIEQQMQGFVTSPVISVLTPVYNVDAKYLKKCIESVRAQYYPHWELCLCDDASTRAETRAALAEYQGTDPRIKVVYLDRNLGISGATNRAAEISTGDYIALLDNDDELSPDALFEVVNALNEDHDVDFLYSDEDKIAEDGTYCDHYFKPDWSPEHLHSVMYLLHLLVFRKELFYEAGEFRQEVTGAQDYDLALRLSRRARKIRHIPKVLYHWRKIASSAASKVDAKPAALLAAERALAQDLEVSGVAAEVQPGLFQGSFRVKHRIAGSPRVTLCITTNDGEADVPKRGRINLVSHFVQSIAERTDYKNYEILLIDNCNLSAATRKRLDGIEYRVKSYTGSQKPFNFASKANFAFSQITTEHLVLLNDDLEVINPEWLSALLEFSQQREIGAVGGKLLFTDDTIQHAGVVLGVNGTAAHVYHHYPRQFIGYNGFTHLIRNYSALTGACLATRRTVIEETGGFDEKLAIDFNDIAFCLAAIERGYRNVYTPYCELYHFESVTAKRTTQNPAEIEHFLRRWSKYVERDPYYNPNLTRYQANFAAALV